MWVSLSIVSRLTRIIRSIDPTGANFQVNDPVLCEIRGDENHNLPLSLLLNLLYYTIENCPFESPLWHCVFMKICLIFYSYYTVTLLCMFCTYWYSFIMLYYKFTYLKTPPLPQQLAPASFCSLVRCTIHYTKWPGSSLWYFGYILACSLISTLN